MTKQELERRAIYLEQLVENDCFYSEEEVEEAERELRTVYAILNKMYELENE